ncbi:hypothetical protein F183_A06750 [Bryobacterales bacterium F-183]|nr:hypothetical protein F183_A06750 [Bryobacterales bacterium F-183]
MRSLLSLVLFFASTALLPAQLVIDSQVGRYLELTPQQTVTVTRLRAANVQFRLQKAERMAVVNREIQAELRKSPLDPMAIGLRYVELATIDKEIAEADAKLKTDLRALLTEAQKLKLVPLEEALRLQDLANQAVCEGFIEPPVTRSTASAGRAGCFSAFVRPNAQ